MWDAVEADFQRDYGIDLMEQLDIMSWRKFVSLFRNLSPFGAVANRADELREEEADAETDKAQATAFFANMLSTRG